MRRSCGPMRCTQVNDVDAQRGPSAKARIKERFLSQARAKIGLQVVRYSFLKKKTIIVISACLCRSRFTVGCLMCLCIYQRMCLCMCQCMCQCLCLCMCLCMCLYVCACVCGYVCVCHLSQRNDAFQNALKGSSLFK